MKRFRIWSSLFLIGAVSVASALLPQQAQAQISTKEQIAQQTEFEKTIPKLQITDEFLDLLIPDMTMGETMGVSTNSKGHLFVYSRTNPQGIARGGTAAMLFEFDQNMKYVKQWGPHNYAASFAHSVRVDKDDNVWMEDEGSGMIIKFNPQAVPKAQYGRTPEAIDYLEEFLEHGGTGFNNAGGRPRDPHPVGRIGTFDRPTDLTWDSQGNVYVSDGYGNSRIVKITPGGHWVKEVGTYGTGQDQFRIPHSIAADAHDTIYVADRNNSRIQVYDSDLNFKKSYTGVGSPWGICVTPGSPQYLFSADGTTGKIYKLSLDGKVLGWAQTSLGRGEDDNGRLVHEITCPSANLLYLGSAVLWNVQKVTIH
jgi:NHL repeat